MINKKTSLLLILGLLAGLAIQVSAVKTASQMKALEGSTQEDEGHCEFPVIVEESTPNCTNIYDIIEITTKQLILLTQARQLTINQITALRESYAFIEATCEEGIYGIQSLSLIQMSDKFQKYNEQTRNILPSTELLERKALTAFLSASELLQDASHCTEEEVEERCEGYLEETNTTIALYEAFLLEINTKIEYITERTVTLQVWIKENYLYCRCLDENTYSDEPCCGVSPFSDTLNCKCHNDYSDELCCDILPYSKSVQCQCHKDHSDLDLCCPLKEFADSDECVCRDTKQFTTERCCDIEPYRGSDVRCSCARDFTTTPCCDLQEYKEDKRCSCLENFKQDCCDKFYPDDFRCTCEYGEWDTTFCCDYERYSSDPRCECLEKFQIEPCCAYGSPFSKRIECECHKPLTDFDDYVKCCDQPEHQTNPHCVCLNPDTFTAKQCCGFDEYENRPECLCRNPATFTTAPCCKYEEYTYRHECICLEQQNAIEKGSNCCDQPQFFDDDHLCRCLRQDAPTTPEICCDVSHFQDTKECQCLKQDDPVSPSHCCDYAPFNTDSTWAHICECAGRNSPYDPENPSLNCCDVAPFDTQSLRCECDRKFDEYRCCPSDDFTNDPRCSCWQQDRDPLRPEDCCRAPQWIKHQECLCRDQPQDAPFSPYYCCDTDGFRDNHLCICSRQDQPITEKNNCCDTKYHAYSMECRCEAQENPLAPENCCGYKDFGDRNIECDCAVQFQKTGLAYVEGGYDCCDLTGYEKHEQCRCRIEEQFNAETCCQYPEIEQLHEKECDCQQLKTPTAECCGYPKFVKDPFCLCLAQGEESPLYPRDCCEYYPDHIECKCRDAREPFPQERDYDCCKAERFQNDKRCLCAPQVDANEPLQPDDCCDQSAFQGDERCICNKLDLSKELPVSKYFNCCNIETFEDHEQCQCFQDFSAKECCKYQQFQDEIECKCARQQDSPDEPESCCEYAPWEATDECRCRGQDNAFEPLACCDYKPWIKTHECLCDNSLYAITEDLNCCDTEKFQLDLDCICAKPDDETKLKHCCKHRNFIDDLECICQYRHDFPITDEYNCCELESHRQDTQCQCEVNFEADKCCAFYPDRHECRCLRDGGDEIPILKCCDVDGFSTRQECICQNSEFTVKPCCDYSLFQDRDECTCYLQKEPLREKYCCDDEKFVNTHECICYGVEDASVVQRDARDCCDTVSADDHNCVCKYQPKPFGDQNCCDNARFVNDLRCTCADPPAPLSSLECCADNRFADYQECRCKDVKTPFTPATEDAPALDCCDQPQFAGHPLCGCLAVFDSTKCCGFDYFQDRHECICQVQENSHKPEDCCDMSYWSNDEWCNCRAQIEKTGHFTHPNYCCNFNEEAASSHICQCAVQSQDSPNSPEKCCDTKYFENNIECLCAAQETSLEPVNCCAFREKNDPECYCRTLTDHFSNNGVVDCCELKEYASQPECECYHKWDSSCCRYDAFSGEHECLCRNQKVPITKELDCCDQPMWESSHECICAKQSIESPTVPENCCDKSPFAETDLCKCEASDSPIAEDGTDCCQVGNKFNKHPQCYCPRIENPTDDLACCNLAAYSETVECRCNEYTFDDDFCCDYSEFEFDPRCGDPFIPKCRKQLEQTNTLSKECCNRVEFQDNPLCCVYGWNARCCALSEYFSDIKCCAFKTEPIGEGYNCCDSPKFEDNEKCRCLQETRPISAECCKVNPYDTFTGYHECICNAQETPINYAQNPPYDCCDVEKFRDDHRCNCAQQVAETGNYLSPIQCCDISLYKDQHECICAGQTNPFPNDCCNSITHQNNPRCKCATQKETSLTSPIDCCALAEYMSYDECQCKRRFTLPGCCVYNPDHEGCEKEIIACYSNDTILVDYEETTENYLHDDLTITILDGLVFFNPLIDSDYQTIQLIDGATLLTIDSGSLTLNGLSTFSAVESTIFINELPWEGTFSVNVLINAANVAEETTIYSTSHFTVSFNLNANAVEYNVRDLSDTVVATVTVVTETANNDWWTHLQGDERKEFFNTYIPQKVELGFDGRDCWLTIVSINDRVFESGIWRGLVPTTESVGNIGTANEIEIRDHFGVFTLGDITSDNVISISYVYLIAGRDDSLQLLRPIVNVYPYNPQNNQNAEGACVVTFDWSKVSLLPKAECEDSNANSQYGTIRTIQFIHSLMHVPSYRFCGTVSPLTDDLAIKSHICEACECLQEDTSASHHIEFGSGLLSVGLNDLVALSTNFEDYNPTLTLDENGANLYLVADYEAGVRSLFSLDDLDTIVTAKLAFDFSVVSFPIEVYNAYYPNPVAELVFNVRILGQKTISVVFSVRRDGNTGDYQVNRKLEGALKTSGVNATITTGGTTNYASSINFNWAQQTTQNTLADFVASASSSVNSDPVTYIDEKSAEVEISFQTYLSFGQSHGYFQQTGFIPDRNAVFKITNLNIQVERA